MLRYLVLALLLLGVAACSSGGKPFSTPYASGHYVDAPIQCVPYARDVSGIQIYGDAHTWWQQAASRYTRGVRPVAGAVLVLGRSNRLRYGHVAVVKRVVSPRLIDVAHSNWGDNRSSRSMIYESMRVEDISPANNWSSVRFWNYHLGRFGLPYPAQGFIYR
jgi:hypothetical protein